ncbi:MULTISPECIES: DUF805 domain-containing protein [Pontibacillus]|uniref:DUF805 domain-containing protein n=1 Tax=Pontibacillus chungwhensis TaxID=265426 RepID=A0ABY8V3P8_9BACI|nr:MULTISPECIES: DUF805 domain-containing protein [Pontibacillus]MCD5324487.1 DUF805 domain-containing protein [Pontibacillus sp. HN14]WIF99219.1 DUF805 domain-containing protein [Pontibacillus chungwhensis]
MDWYLKVLKNYATFEGRARRMEYWMFFLINTIILIALAVVQEVLDLRPILTTFYNLAVLIPSLAVAVRRLHDTGRSGLWVLISFIPVIGGIIFIVFMCLDSEPYENDYGPNPEHKSA